MMWQDVVFLTGSALSIAVLTPTLRDSMARVPLGTSVPSALLGILYGMTFLSMHMTLSAAGSLLAGLMWSLIAYLRAPRDGADSRSPPASRTHTPGAD